MNFNIFKDLFRSDNSINSDSKFFFQNNFEESNFHHAENLARCGFSDEQIMGSTGFSQNEVDYIKNQNGIF